MMHGHDVTYGKEEVDTSELVQRAFDKEWLWCYSIAEGIENAENISEWSIHR